MDIIIYVFAFIFGIIIGSFLNVVIYRLPNNISIVKPDSHCPHCKTFIKWYDNVPLLSYIFLNGKCRTCKTKISPRYFLVELFTGLLFLFNVIYYGLNFTSVISIILGCVFICIFLIDIDHYIIPDSMIVIIILLGLVSLITDLFIDVSDLSYLDRIIGFVSFGGVFLLIAIIGEKVLKKEAMGGGDIKLVAACGLVIGWKLMILGVFGGALIALFLEIPKIMLNKRGRYEEIPFGPYLVLGIYLSSLFGNILLEWYFGLFL